MIAQSRTVKNNFKCVFNLLISGAAFRWVTCCIIPCVCDRGDISCSNKDKFDDDDDDDDDDDSTENAVLSA